MKYVITGSSGHISKPIIIGLVKAGHDVTVISRNQDRVKEITGLGARALIGAIEDTAFLTKAFGGADAVYTMVPPKYEVQDWKAYIGQIGQNYATAIKHNQVKYVVNLSSVGADKAEGCGPVSGLYRAEKALNTLEDVHIKHLRPGYFYINFLSSIHVVKSMGIIGSNFSFQDKKFVVADTDDIAVVALQSLLALDFTGHTTQYIASDEVSTNDIAATLGKAINKPDLQWVTFTDEQAVQGALQAGLPEELAKNFAEMGHALQTGEMLNDYWKHRTAELGKVKLADFAKIFAAAYNAG
ncbi:MAG: NmrA family NAD(P)-binding protein [Bacteroidota bacterium]